MLNGKELGQAIEAAYNLKKAAGKISSKADVARHFGIRTPSVYDWIKKGSISKDKLPELWSYFSDVVGPEHWGLSEWPCPLRQGASEEQHKVCESPSIPQKGKDVAEKYLSANDETRAAIDLILLPKKERLLLKASLMLAIATLEESAQEALIERKNGAAAA